MSCTDIWAMRGSAPSRRRSRVIPCRTEDTRLSAASTTSEAASASSTPTSTTAPPSLTRRRRPRSLPPPALLLSLLPCLSPNSRRRCSEAGWLVSGCSATDWGEFFSAWTSRCWQEKKFYDVCSRPSAAVTLKLKSNSSWKTNFSRGSKILWLKC